MTVRPLELYAPLEQVHSATSTRVYAVRSIDGHLSCECEFVRHHPGTPCRHILEIQRNQARLQLGILMQDRDMVQEALEDYQEVLESVLFFHNGEARSLAALAISLAKHSLDHTVTADDIYEAYGGASAFESRPNIVGMVVTRLLREKRAQIVGTEHSRRNHGRPIVRIRIAEGTA